MTERTDSFDFYREVSQTAHELGATHGQSALSYATKQAERAHAEGRLDDHRFWGAVAATMTPR
jgi:hypothetical protein